MILKIQIVGSVQSADNVPLSYPLSFNNACLIKGLLHKRVLLFTLHTVFLGSVQAVRTLDKRRKLCVAGTILGTTKHGSDKGQRDSSRKDVGTRSGRPDTNICWF